jgi:hypothetical protein
MGALNLLAKARAADLAVQVEGDQLDIYGPKQAETIVLLLLENKTAVMAALAAAEPQHIETIKPRPGMVRVRRKKIPLAQRRKIPSQRRL